MGQFVNGLKDDIKAELTLLNTISLEQAMEVAAQAEERIRVSGSKKGGSFYQAKEKQVPFQFTLLG